MADSGEQFFRADKANRNAAFSFRNGLGNQDPPETDGDQASRVHPFPAMLGQSQKVGDTHDEAGYEARSVGAQARE